MIAMHSTHMCICSAHKQSIAKFEFICSCMNMHDMCTCVQYVWEVFKSLQTSAVIVAMLKERLKESFKELGGWWRGHR